MLIYMHLITLFRIMNPHQGCLQAKVKVYIYTSTIKSPSAVQMSKSIKQTQSVDKLYYTTRV